MPDFQSVPERILVFVFFQELFQMLTHKYPAAVVVPPTRCVLGHLRRFIERCERRTLKGKFWEVGLFHLETHHSYRAD